MLCGVKSLLQHLDARIRIWYKNKQTGNLAQSCLVKVQAGASDVVVWGITIIIIIIFAHFWALSTN